MVGAESLSVGFYLRTDAITIMLLRLSFLVFFLSSLLFASAVNPQSPQRKVTLAVLDFGESRVGKVASDTLWASLKSAAQVNVIDREETRAAMKGIGYAGSLNLSRQEARSLGEAIGSDFYLIGDAQTLRRSSSTRPVYFESYASIFLVSSRTGRLITWQRPSFQASSAEDSEKQLIAELANDQNRTRNIAAILKTLEDERLLRELAIDGKTPVIEVAPDDERLAELEGLRLPRPYRRLRPAYPETAARAEVEATVDVLADLDANGEVSNVEVARWAGFGLDEATVETVRQLHFFPATRNGTATPIRVLLRYTFRKPPK